ncbi:type I-G CRISPR-associated protein Csb2 [Blastochloris tepida]|uniref:Type I-U CRISPR-associated protein Cas5/Cas6 n=1 Tax=Blastochloris tepida TaxID=2233851 RepID=A0A348G311_9HYPH|nr:type I-U CRISPR-associated protein Csb2 [Blastochloris tepida]BBF93944.1 hypothetical protein BLTE_26290 [Blastochloris tepida]
MTLVLEVEFLAGVAFAAVGPDSDRPDWPPQPDRVFSALVASWAARGARADEAEALRWLEARPAPRIVASPAAARSAPASFVPPNDPETGRKGNVAVLPGFRARQPRRFPAARPHDPIVRFVWADADPDHATLAALDALAMDTAYVGHSASLTRCRFRREIEPDAFADARPAQRRVYDGRLAELTAAFEAGRRPSQGARVAPVPVVGAPPRQSVFDSRWLLLEDVDGKMRDIRAAALVAKAIRDTLLDGYGSLGVPRERIPEIVSGHMPDGAPTRVPHLAIVPLAFVGARHADGRVLGFALVPPRGSGLLDDPEFLAALRSKAELIEERGRRIMEVASPEGTPRDRAFRIELSPTLRAERASLEPAPYLGPARTFATVTPIVLDRHLKARGPARRAEIVEQIVAACRNTGLPDPEIITADGATLAAVVPDKHSAFEGAVSAWPSGNAPSWTRWRLPASLASRSLVHAVIRFAEPVAGPVILGAGRFVGLGLLRVLEEEVEP